jgi:hypothetical protein
MNKPPVSAGLLGEKACGLVDKIPTFQRKIGIYLQVHLALLPRPTSTSSPL